jgi:hypothetical protein
MKTPRGKRQTDHSDRAAHGVGHGNSNTGVVGSDSTRCIYICWRLSVLCCPVKVEVLRSADPHLRSYTRCGNKVRASGRNIV